MVYIVTGPCIDCTWYSATCPATLSVTGTAADAASVVSASINLSGRGKVGGLCAGSDEYISFVTNGSGRSFSATIDIWRAYVDGVWSSSTTALIYVASTGVVAAGDGVLASSPSVFLNKSGAFQSTGACPTTLIATITMMDNGSFTLT